MIGIRFSWTAPLSPRLTRTGWRVSLIGRWAARVDASDPGFIDETGKLPRRLPRGAFAAAFMAGGLTAKTGFPRMLGGER